jgi:hypothetical protein
MRPYTPYVPQTPGEVWDMLGSMILGAPRFLDRTGYFPHRNIDTEFEGLTAGFDVIRKKLGEERYAKLMALAAQAKLLFIDAVEEAPEKERAGRDLLFAMEDILNEIRRRKPPGPTAPA